MEIVTTTTILPPELGGKEILHRLYDCGFSHLDMGLDAFPELVMGDSYETWATEIREEAERLGVVFTHAHAGFAHSGLILDIPDRNLRCLRCAEILGAKYLVVHPIWRKMYADTEEESFLFGEQFIRKNAEAILPLLESAEAHRVILLTENLQFGGSQYPEVIAELLDQISSPWFGWCFDTGHACTKGIDIERLRNGRVPLSLHVHDDIGEGNDLHMFPGMGIFDWDKFLRILKDIGYRGDLVLEADLPCRRSADKDLQNDLLHVLLCKAQHMRKQFENL